MYLTSFGANLEPPESHIYPSFGRYSWRNSVWFRSCRVYIPFRLQERILLRDWRPLVAAKRVQGRVFGSWDESDGLRKTKHEGTNDSSLALIGLSNRRKEKEKYWLHAELQRHK